eukprot:4616723-Karenia_brevis.AAC.1
MLKYRGPKSVEAMRARMVDGRLQIKLPQGANRQYLGVVREYKHVGSMRSVDCSIAPDAKHRAQLATGAYIPIAGRAFGAKSIPLDLKIQFAESLVFSRLFYNIHIWVANTTYALKTINRVYMQVARKIADACRFAAEGNCTDLNIRNKIKFPSVECRLRRQRLLYASRLIRHGPPALHALLHFCGGR